MSNKLSTYTITHKETGEKKLVLPHTFGGSGADAFVIFADADLSGNLPEWTSASEEKGNAYKFANPEQKGDLSSEVYDIELTPTEA